MVHPNRGRCRLFFCASLGACAALALARATPAHASEAQASEGPASWVAVDAATLERQRGGFTSAAGLEVSLGIERLVSINGELVSRTRLHIADVGKLEAGQARETGATLSALKLIQNGSDNMVQAGFSGDMLAGTVIQNSLNDQQIESRTVINASVNSVGLLKTINFHGNVSDAIARAVVPR